MKPTGAAAAARAVQALDEGITYERMDCKEFIEYIVRQCGGTLTTSGSNDLPRNHSVYLATVGNARAEGKLVEGALLLIHEETEADLPARYRGDGLGDFSHVAMYVGENATDDVDKNGKRRKCNAMHSSQSMGRVAGTTVSNGYTHLMLLDCLDYGVDAGGLSLGAEAEIILNDEPGQTGRVVSNEGETVQAAAMAYVRVTSADGGAVRIREKPEKGAIWKYAAPVGTRLMVLGEKNGYYRVMYKGKARWIDKRFAAVE